jgi:hypothetical protein
MEDVTPAIATLEAALAEVDQILRPLLERNPADIKAQVCERV